MSKNVKSKKSAAKKVAKSFVPAKKIAAQAPSATLERQLIFLKFASSRAFARQLIKTSRVTVNGVVTRVRDLTVKGSDKVAILAEPNTTAPGIDAKPKLGRAGVDWRAAGLKAWETRRAREAAAAPQQASA